MQFSHEQRPVLCSSLIPGVAALPKAHALEQ